MVVLDCWIWPSSRDSVQRFRDLYERSSKLPLAEMTKADPNLKNRAPPEIEAAVVAIRVEHPPLGQARVLSEWRQMGIEVALLSPHARTCTDLPKKRHMPSAWSRLSVCGLGA